ncbi:MAG: NUDIX hydrolase [Acidimicrobiales bacterium]
MLVPLYEAGGQARVVLTRRTTTLPSHQGEVSFPGGKVHEGEGLVEAALREAREEIGLDSATVEILGELDHLATVAGKFHIAPFVGLLGPDPRFTANPGEVDAILDVALVDLLGEDVFREERWDIPPDKDRPVHFFEVGEDTIWGATARILFQLLVICTRCGPST